MATIKGQGGSSERVFITSDERAHFWQQELSGIGNAFGIGDLRALVICQWWHDGECMNAWHIETEEQRRDMIRKLEELLADLKKED